MRFPIFWLTFAYTCKVFIWGWPPPHEALKPILWPRFGLCEYQLSKFQNAHYCLTLTKWYMPKGTKITREGGSSIHLQAVSFIPLPTSSSPPDAYRSAILLVAWISRPSRFCSAPLREECPQHHGHKGTPEWHPRLVVPLVRRTKWS
jgi:hypothetical protein